MDFTFSCKESTDFVIADEKPITQNPADFSANFPPEAQVSVSDFHATRSLSVARLRKNNKFKEFIAHKKAQKRKAKMEPNTNGENTSPAKRGRMLNIISDVTKTPMMRLNELQLKYELDVDAVPNSTLFKAAIVLDGKTFEGVAPSKQDAKQKVASIVLQHLSSGGNGDETKMDVSNEQVPSMAKTPVSIINELFGKNWKVEEEKAAEGNKFETRISLGKYGEFVGVGRSKKDAKHAAAMAGILKILQIPSLSALSTEQLNAVIHHFRQYEAIPFGMIQSPSNFPRSSASILTSSYNSNTSLTSGMPGIPVSAAAPMQRSSSSPLACIQLPGGVAKSHLQLLNERFGPNKISLTFCGEEGPANKKTFHVKIKVEGIEDEFLASGLSKQLAKQNAAAMVLASLSINEPESVLPPIGEPRTGIFESSQPTSNSWSDCVARMVQAKFQELTEGTEWSRRTVLAGIVMTSDDNFETSAQLICVATGTKCLSANHLSVSGTALLDCHAEILCRRALCRYFYSHLMAMGNPVLAPNAIFEPRPDGKGGYRLKPQFRFHLYVSTAPCGDSRIFVSLDDVQEQNSDRNPERVNRGLLRTKVENGEGTIPSIEEARQTLDGILGGDRLLVVSCSDKILAWNHLGLQGNLLSHFIEPVYLTSIVIGSAFSQDHLQRALITRLEHIKMPDEQFSLHKPTILSTSRPEQRFPCKPPKFSLLWTLCDPAFEIVDCTTGRSMEGTGQSNKASSVSKLTLFRLFSSLEPKASKIVASDSAARCSKYGEAKKLNSAYQVTKSTLTKAFRDNLFGIWPIKPHELEDFAIPSNCTNIGLN